MIHKYCLNPPDMWSRYENGELLYSPIIAVQTDTHTHIFLSGQVSRLNTGEVIGIGDMRVQIKQVCKNIEKGLTHVGATLDDVVKGTTYVTDLNLYFMHSDERYKFFSHSRPTNTLIPVEKLGADGCMIEIQCEALIDSDRFKFNTEHLI